MKFLTGLSWSPTELQNAMQISSDGMRRLQTNGRFMSFLVTEALAMECHSSVTWRVNDLNIVDGCAVRMLTEHGVAFAPNRIFGTQRQFNEMKFHQWIRTLEGFYVAKINSFPSIPVYELSIYEVLILFEQGKMPQGKMSYDNFCELLKGCRR